MMELNQDYKYNAGLKERMVLIAFRVSNQIAVKKKSNPLIWILGLPVLVLYRICIEWMLGIEIPAKTKIGRGLGLRHGQGLVIHPEAIIGSYVTLRHCTTIGNKNGPDGPTKPPVIEDGVDIGCHVVIIGNINIGAGSCIGAGSVVIKDVPPGSVVVGNPAKPIN